MKSKVGLNIKSPPKRVTHADLPDRDWDAHQAWLDKHVWPVIPEGEGT